MKQNNDANNNPLNSIFITDSQGKTTSEIESLKHINGFFEYLKEPNIDNDNKSLIIDQFTKKVKDNRYISEYFSSYENKSIYLYLFDLYISNKSSEKLKSVILKLIDVLIYSVETNKEVYEYLFQNISQISKLYFYI